MAASHTYAATARVRQRGFANCRVRLESIICSKPSADPAAACCCCERRIFRASHRHVRHIACARRRRLFAVEPFADATRAVRWRLMSRQALHSTRQRRNRQRRKSRFRGGFALRHALFQLVAACGFVACQSYKLHVSKHAPDRLVRSARNDFFHQTNSHAKSFWRCRFPPRKPHRTHAARTMRHACATTDYFEMVSSAMPFVRGPMSPIAAITIAIAPAMNANTPKVPKPFSTAAITNDEKIAEKRLHE